MSTSKLRATLKHHKVHGVCHACHNWSHNIWHCSHCHEFYCQQCGRRHTSAVNGHRTRKIKLLITQ